LSAIIQWTVGVSDFDTCARINCANLTQAGYKSLAFLRHLTALHGGDAVG
jgi:hypothetical protein